MIKGLTGFLKKIFFGQGDQPDAEKKMGAAKKPGKETRVLQPAYTVRLKPEQQDRPAPACQKAPAPGSSSKTDTSLVWCGLTDTGMERDHNEDFFSCTEFGESVLFAVADGMGGHDAGEVASRLAVDTVCREVGKGAHGRYDPQRLLEQAVQRANEEVLRTGASQGSDMGTTLTLALVTQDRAHVACVGDSRAYWMENGSIRQITEDHTLVAKLVSAGKLTREEARNHPKSNLLYRTIGSDKLVKVDTFHVDLKKGGSLLLCSDGLWNEVTDEEMHRICVTDEDTRAACTRLVETANKNGGKDNITAVLVRVM